MSEGRTASRKVVLVTGASAGIGVAVAREAARRGYHLVLTARRGDRLEGLAAEIRASGSGSEVVTVAADLDDPETPERLVAEALGRFGRLDVLINNAGFGLPTLFADADPDELRRQLVVNLVAPMLLTRLALPALIERKGMVINIGSAITALPNPALGAYGATKAALAYWSTALRRELRHQGVKVCLVEPGPVKTEFFDALIGLAPRPGGYHPMLDAPAPWMSARVDVVARRVVALIERPRRRLSVLRRVVWPWRLAGGLFALWPALGDLGVSSILRYHEAKGPRRKPGDDQRALRHANANATDSD
jgi:short-subunit dehydrogenase